MYHYRKSNVTGTEEIHFNKINTNINFNKLILIYMS